MNKRINIIVFISAIAIVGCIIMYLKFNSPKSEWILNSSEILELSKSEQKYFRFDSISISKEDTSILFIDLRPKDRFELSHIKNSINISVSEALNEKNIELYKSKKTVFICSTGITSNYIWMLLTQKGLKNICTLPGGYKGILEKNFTELNDEKPEFDFQSLASTENSTKSSETINTTNSTTPKPAKKKKKGASGGCS